MSFTFVAMGMVSPDHSGYATPGRYLYSSYNEAKLATPRFLQKLLDLDEPPDINLTDWEYNTDWEVWLITYEAVTIFLYGTKVFDPERQGN